MDELTKESQDELTLCMFAVDIVLIDKIKEGLSKILGSCREALEREGIMIGHMKA